jgi:diacylglycerol kinase family enzyme
MSVSRVLLVYNPTAGDGLDVDRIVSLAERAGHAVEAQSVKEDEWAAALQQDLDLIAAAGGDGTVRKVFKRLAGTEHTATLLPVGSANNIARSLGYSDEDPERLVEGWTGGTHVRFDLGQLTWGSEHETFVESAGGGVFAAQLDRAERVEREPEDKVEFGLRNLVEVVPDAPAREWGVRADGRDLSGPFLGVEVTNVRETGPNVPLGSAATGDGALDLALIAEEHRGSFLEYLHSRLAGREAEPPRFDVFRAGRIELTPPGGAHFRVDDELVPRYHGEPVTAQVDGSVQLLLPS